MDRTVHQIKSRTAALGLKNVDLIRMLDERGIKSSPSHYSDVVNLRVATPKAYDITSTANELLTELEQKSYPPPKMPVVDSTVDSTEISRRCNRIRIRIRIIYL